MYPFLGASLEGAFWLNFFAATGEYFYHSNIKSPKWMKHFIQTPELHSIHHQLDVHKYNYSDLPIWDKLFGTYKDTDVFMDHCGFPCDNERKLWKIAATDLSADALAVARRNGERLAPGRIEWLAGDWFAPLAGRRFDCLVSNPPYIAADDPVLAGDGLEHEPRGALTPGGDGTAALATLINGAPDHLVAGGWLALEHGSSQGEWTRSALVARGFTHVTSAPDLAGHERATFGQWSN